MRRVALVLVALAAPAAADTSGRRSAPDPRRFTEVAAYDANRRAWMLSPDGRVFVTRLQKEIGVYEAATGRELGKLKGHAENLHDAGWSRNGRYFATAGYDATVRVWDLVQLKQVAAIEAHAGFS